MVDRRVGVLTTHNEPSTLTHEEKVVRAKRRRLTREIDIMTGRLAKFEAMLETTQDPVRQATIQAQIKLTSQWIVSSEEMLAELAVGVVN